MATTQEHLSIYDIKEDIVLLKDGGAALVLETNAVNFGLLSEREQIAIIEAFAQMLNSLSFSIQIVIHSKRLDITSYLILLEQAQREQKNPLLSQMIAKYRLFIQNTIKENDVLDKNFYIIIHALGVEMGIRSLDTAAKLQKSKTLLLPRREQILRQLSRIGLKGTQLSNTQLVTLFYDIYNQQADVIELGKIEIQPVTLGTPNQPPQIPTPQVAPTQQSVPQPANQTVNPQIAPMPQPPQRSNAHPFVVEELHE